MTDRDLPFLILTRTGFEDLQSRPALPSLAYLNPGLATSEEIAGLRARGCELRLLDAPLAPQMLPEVGSALPGGAPDTFWLEATLPRKVPDAPKTADEPAGGKLRQRLASTAGAFAGFALRHLRDPGARRQLQVLPYLGFGNPTGLWIKGRLLDEYSFREQGKDDSSWRNMVALYRHLESDEVVGARVVAHFQGRSYETVSDQGGYFAFEIAPAEPLAGGWYTVELEVPEARTPDGKGVRAQAEVNVPPASARFGIISDIDDTVLWTNVTNKLNMMLMLARSNAHTRKPFKGVAAFYRALHRGASGQEHNPMFYVSSSPWHLYGPLLQFLRMQEIPVGPLLLRELGIRQLFKLTEHENHKLEKIELILSFYPDMQFVLIGDSGERDPEIYTEVVRRHPKQVRMIYIRNVNPDPARIDALDRLIEEVSQTGVQLVLSPDSVFAASHAAAEGLIQVDKLATVRVDKQQDDAAPPDEA